MSHSRLSRRDVSVLTRLLGVLQSHLESAIEGALIPGTGKAMRGEAGGVAIDRRDWRLAENLIKKLNPILAVILLGAVIQRLPFKPQRVSSLTIGRTPRIVIPNPTRELGVESGNSNAVKPKGYVSKPRLPVNVAKRTKRSEQAGEVGSGETTQTSTSTGASTRSVGSLLAGLDASAVERRGV